MEKITSRENAKVKYACRLASSGAFRRAEGRFLACLLYTSPNSSPRWQRRACVPSPKRRSAPSRTTPHLSSLRDTQNMKAWFYRILVNECLTWLRKSKRLYVVPGEFFEGIQNGEHTEKFDENLDLYKAILRLDAKLKTVVLLRFFEGMKLEEIASVTNTRLSTVKTRLYRALRELKSVLEEEISA